MYISNSKLNSIIPIIDYNDRTILGDLSKTYPNFNLRNKLSGFGLKVIDFNGHNFDEIKNSVTDALISETPSCLLARTIKGKGISFMEESYLWHNKMPNEELFKKAISELKLTINRWIILYCKEDSIIKYLDKIKNEKIKFISPDFGAKPLDDFRINNSNSFIYPGIAEQVSVDIAYGISLGDSPTNCIWNVPFYFGKMLWAIQGLIWSNK